MTLAFQHRVSLVTAPANEPVTVTDAKNHMRIEHTDDDALIARLINVAIAYVDVTGALGKAMISQTWAEYVGPNPSTVYLSLQPAQSVTAIKYFDTDNALQTATLSDFHLLGQPGRYLIYPKSGKVWPTTFSRDDAIRIEYVVGYGDNAADVPDTVRHALLMLVAHYYENRENELIGTISKTLPFGFDDLIGQERAAWYG